MGPVARGVFRRAPVTEEVHQVAQIMSIDLDGNEEPESVVMRVTRAEATLIAKLTGWQSPQTANEVMPGGSIASQGLYEALTGSVFNRFWDGGVTEAVES